MDEGERETGSVGAESEDAESEDAGRVRRERDLYLRLLELGEEPDLPTLLREALASIAGIVGAERAYLEASTDDEPRWAAAGGLSEADVEAVQAVISRGIIAEAIAAGTTIQTPSAMLDQRFRQHASVQRNQIEAVLCTPLGRGEPLGVVYLQGRAGDGRFPAPDVALVERFARHIAPFLDRLRLIEQRDLQSDATRRWRDELRAEGFIGRSVVIAQVLQEVALIAPRNIAVLITGPSGTGKTALAEVIHRNSPRRARPFVEINCANLPEALAESELFGALAGAHSTAKAKIDGKVAAAEGGTLFLDEIAELPLPVQAKLLQLLQSKQYYPLGGSRALTADVRVLAATNDDLDRRVRGRTFREDLFHRLNVLPIRMPSLAERSEDIEPLAAHFCRELGAREGATELRVSAGALQALRLSDWPGNIRQLHNVLHASVIRAIGEGSAVIERRHVFPERGAGDAPGPADQAIDFQEATRRFQAGLLAEALAATDWNVSKAARRLGLPRSTMYNLIRALGVERG